MIKNHIVGMTILTSTMMLINTAPSLAKPITYDFTVEVSQGSLAGNSYTGSFRAIQEKSHPIATQC